jgi:hypothetical protein
MKKQTGKTAESPDRKSKHPIIDAYLRMIKIDLDAPKTKK